MDKKDVKRVKRPCADWVKIAAELIGKQLVDASQSDCEEMPAEIEQRGRLWIALEMTKMYGQAITANLQKMKVEADLVSGRDGDTMLYHNKNTGEVVVFAATPESGEWLMELINSNTKTDCEVDCGQE